VLVAVAALAIAAAALYQRFYRAGPGAVHTLPVGSCNLQQHACAAPLPGGSLHFDITPRPIRTMQTLSLQLTINGIAPRAVAVDFSGVNMDMGYNRFVLTAAGHGRYIGRAALPVCTRNHMLWEAKVLLTGADGAVTAVPYRFATHHR